MGVVDWPAEPSDVCTYVKGFGSRSQPRESRQTVLRTRTKNPSTMLVYMACQFSQKKA